MIIKLLYGDGFAGRSYTMKIGNGYYHLHHGLESPVDEEAARKYAVSILK